MRITAQTSRYEQRKFYRSWDMEQREAVSTLMACANIQPPKAHSQVEHVETEALQHSIVYGQFFSHRPAYGSS